MKYILLLALLVSTAKAELPAKFVKAIHQVETGGRTGNIIGDNGKAKGPLQIHKCCWQDSKIAGKYEDCADFNYSVKVMEAYLRRYCPGAVKENNFEIMARTWNGGPAGIKNSSTKSYFQKVSKYL